MLVKDVLTGFEPRFSVNLGIGWHQFNRWVARVVVKYYKMPLRRWRGLSMVGIRFVLFLDLKERKQHGGAGGKF